MVGQALTTRTATITVRREDIQKFKDTDALRELLWQDEQDMDVHKQLGVNLGRIRAEDKLYAKIQADRKW